MSTQSVREYLKKYKLDDEIIEFDSSSATVELAAEAIGCEPKQIAKSITLLNGERAILIVASGDTKIDNKKFKERFGVKATMLKPEQVIELVGHAIGGVCPFAVKDSVDIYFDEALKRFDYVYPAAGSSNSVIKLTLSTMEEIAENFKGYVDVCKFIEG
ncbi:MAG: YbaK/EbsC family protein [Clostridiales bacterium]|nr:YbaK/EbsC family protein [Clostridiales bacterium]